MLAALVAVCTLVAAARVVSAATTDTTTRPEVSGAVVISNTDPTGLGRIKVKFTLSPPGQDNVGWARPVLPLTTSTYELPQKGDEVLVAFLDGDINRPVILGRFENAP
jgi:uncharacterized protein involved in type VI secretion and phage assembly